MFEFKIKVPCRRPKDVVESLRPDVKSDRYSKIRLVARKGFVEIHVVSSKIGHMKAIVNTYISLVQTLEEIERKIK